MESTDANPTAADDRGDERDGEGDDEDDDEGDDEGDGGDGGDVTDKCGFFMRFEVFGFLWDHLFFRHCCCTCERVGAVAPSLLWLMDSE